MPLVLLYNYGENSRTKHTHLMFGIQPSYILKSTAYMGPDQIPSNQSVTNRTWNNLDLKPIEVLAVVGYQHKEEDYGYQFSVKWSLFNINNGLNMKDNDVNVSFFSGKMCKVDKVIDQFKKLISNAIILYLIFSKIFFTTLYKSRVFC